jgi:hypothetical protein
MVLISLVLHTTPPSKKEICENYLLGRKEKKAIYLCWKKIGGAWRYTSAIAAR